RAAAYLHAHGITLEGEIGHPHQAEYHALASLLIAQGRPECAAGLLERALAAYAATQQHGLAISAHLLLALAYQAQGKLPPALQALDLALQAAAPEGYVQTFLNEGRPARDLLEIALRRGLHLAFTRTLLARFPADDLPPAAAPHGSLSPREFEVLRLIAAGLSNQEIASQLCISLRTVKYHTTSIFTKLGVNNRTQAVTFAQTLGLI
ncbi:MAG: LuxR C-terminal-related transcriptional regulator, partial [Anaerolineaceae bacterium]|nr:LuxR C-terminal-related transcriptional regulator [Anaerolineaceae bacterium]